MSDQRPQEHVLHAFDELVQVMAALRGEHGCPWDKEQTHESLRRYLLEEAYEVIDAIDDRNMQALREELGDVLLQVVFHAQLAAEQGVFTAEDVVQSLTAKLIRRHPHVFGEKQAADADDVLGIWQAVKAEENAAKATSEARTSLMDGIPRHYPALMYAQEVGKRAANVGFDWPHAAAVWQKVVEEATELTEAVSELSGTVGNSSDADASPSSAAVQVEEEWGDLMFALVNYARHLRIEPEAAMRRAAAKFEARFRAMEGLARTEGEPLQGRSLSELDALWDRVKGSTDSLKETTAPETDS